MKGWVIGIALMGMTAGCVTTEEANQAIQSRWIGQPSDVFFAQYGPPVSQFAMNDGGTIYTWRGGETSRDVAPVYRPMTEQEKAAARNAPHTVINIGGTYNANPAPPGQVVVSPGRVDYLACEAQITTSPAGIITYIKATRDTDGQGLSFSRCAEVFDVTS